MRSRLNVQDGMIVAGALLLLGSVVGLYADTVAARGMEDSAPLVVRMVTATPAGVLPTLPPLTPQAQDGAAGGAFLVPAAEEQPAAVTVEVTPPAHADPGAPTSVGPTPVGPTPVGPTPAAATTAVPLIPNRLVIPRLGVDAPVYASNYALIEVEGQIYQQWQAPTEYAAGWQFTSAALGVPGNTVLNGHHNVYGEVFAGLYQLVEGDVIEVYSGSRGVSYQVSNVMILAEEGQPLAVRLENAAWLQASTDERLTLVTCWPQWDNTHRVIVVARPAGMVDTQAALP